MSAARPTRLNLSPSAVSHGLGRLRRLLNDPLFLRDAEGRGADRARHRAGGADCRDPGAGRNVRRDRRAVRSRQSTRRFMIGAPDGALAVFLPPLLAALSRSAPGIDIGVQQLLPPQGGDDVERAWEPALADLEARARRRDHPHRHDSCALRCAHAVRRGFRRRDAAGHPFARDPTLDRFCEQQHLLVSSTGDPHGFFDGFWPSQDRRAGSR